MRDRIRSISPQLKARVAGACYMITIAIGAFDHLYVGGKLVALKNAAATARNIIASAPLYHLAFALDLIPVYMVVTVLLYELFRPVSRTLSLLAAFSSLMGGAIGSVLGVFQFAPLVVLGGSGDLHGFSVEQLQALALIFLQLHQSGFTISLVFYGFYCFLLGWLIIASTFMPRAVGLLMAFGGFAYMAYSFTDFISPSLAVSLSPYALAFGGLGESALTLWLLVAGLELSKWRELAGSAI